MIEEPPKPKQRRGFAAMTPEKRRAIARLGGLGQRPENRSFAKDKELARSAGRKGGLHKRQSADRGPPEPPVGFVVGARLRCVGPGRNGWLADQGLYTVVDTMTGAAGFLVELKEVPGILFGPWRFVLAQPNG